MNAERTADRRTARSIATMMRVGTAGATILLFIAVIARWLDDTTATVLLTAGCSVLIALPVVRLLMMAGYFARLHDLRYLLVTLTVLTLVMVGGVVGLAQ